MTFTPEQFMAAHKSNVEAFFGVADKAFQSVEKLVELNVQAARSTFGEFAQSTSAALAARDPQELFALQAGMLQPATEKATAYSRHLYEIMATANAELAKGTETTMAETQKKVLALVDNAVKNAPAGSESAVALVKSVVTASNNAFESLQKASKQAAEVAEANFTAMTNTAVNATKAATTAKGRRAA